jgi:hypothetical protein
MTIQALATDGTRCPSQRRCQRMLTMGCAHSPTNSTAMARTTRAFVSFIAPPRPPSGNDEDTIKLARCRLAF